MPFESSPSARWKRLFAMGAHEIGERTRQEVWKRADFILYRLGKRPRVRLSSLPSVVDPQFFFSSHQVPELAALLRKRMPNEVNATLSRAERICAHRFDLLGYENLDCGMKIDWHLDRVHGKGAPHKPWYSIRYLDFDEVGDAKVTWELNRHQHLVTLAKAYAVSSEERFAKELIAQFYDWTEQNPYPIGVNWASSLEVAFRTLAWLWVKHLLAGAAMPQFADDLRQVLALSGRHIERYLSTYFSPNTHLLGEGVALFFLGVLCPELSSARKWQRLGWRIVLEESESQVLADGMHFEQSAYYHVYALDFFLHAIVLASRNDIPVPEHLERTVEKMLDALLRISQAGVTARFGDDDGGRVFHGRRNRTEHLLDPLATGAVLFGRGDFKRAAGGLRDETAWLLGVEGVKRFDQIENAAVEARSIALRDSGLYIMASAEPEPSQLVIDAGPQGVHGAGHGHADALSIQLAQSGQALLIDPGTGEYVGPNGVRTSFRVTAAHNTVQVDGRSQSDPNGPFSWKRLTNTMVQRWIEGRSFILFAGSHDGYGPILHRRWVFYRKGDFWLVRDLIEGAGQHRVAIRWHLAPGMVQQKKDSRVFASAGPARLGVVPAESSRWSARLSEGEWSPAYGRKEAAPVLQVEYAGALPVETATVLTTASIAPGKLNPVEPSGESPPEHGYCYSEKDKTHKMFFAHAGQSWSWQDWASDAEFLYVRESRDGVEEIIFCNGVWVKFKGRRVVSAERQVESCELSGPEGNIVSAQRQLIRVYAWAETFRSQKAALQPAAARSED
jgi:uncharacterized heparinase superfamily protein